MKLLVLSLLLSTTTASLWPAPVYYTSGSSFVWVAKNVTVTYNNKTLSLEANHKPLSNNFSAEVIVTSAVQRTFTTLFTDNFVPWKFHPRGKISEYEPGTATNKQVFIKTVSITQTEEDLTFVPEAGQVNESYSLSIATDGTTTITAAQLPGVLLGLQSFNQLFYTHSTTGGVYAAAPVQIMDSPKFAHRGMNLDVSRSFYPVEDIKRMIGALAWTKMNRFHIHITDSQAWPLEVPALPLLAQNGAYNKGLSYTPADFADIQTFGIHHGVNVYIEIDSPGHTSVIALAYPELVAAYDAHPYKTYCAEPPCGTLKLNSSAVSRFMETLYDDVLPRVKQYSAYFHTGGDEVKNNAYLLDEGVQSNVTAVIQPLLQKFVNRNHDQIRAAGLVPMVWEEMALDWALELGSDVVVQTWLSNESLNKVTSLGYKALFGNYEEWYLSCGTGAWQSYSNEAFAANYPFIDYCAPFHNWKAMYSYDPLAGLTLNQTALVLGGEVHLWGEQIDPQDVDGMAWPRTAAAAEVLWSGRRDESGQNRSLVDATPRLAEFRERLVLRGIRAMPVQEVFCTQANATECAVL